MDRAKWEWANFRGDVVDEIRFLAKLEVQFGEEFVEKLQQTPNDNLRLRKHNRRNHRSNS
jgi:hypothetical protein